MRDRDIRQALWHHLSELHANEPDTLILDELGLCQGVARVDVAVVNGSISGYEIKSERDTLERLPSQQVTYNRTLDRIYLVASHRHLHDVESIIPDWWGVIEASGIEDGITLTIQREASENPSREGYAIAQLLWRDEVLQILGELGQKRGLSNKPRRALWSLLAESLPFDELRGRVRSQLKARQGWRVANSPLLNDGTLQSDAKSSHSPAQLPLEHTS